MSSKTPMPWFRMYAEFAHDQKVQRLSEVDQRRFVMLLCLRCGNGDVTLQDEDVTFLLRISDAEWSATKSVLLEKNLIGFDNKPTAWEKRQYVSDSSAARVAKHRALHGRYRNGEVTLQKRSGNGVDTDTDVDTDKSTTLSGKPDDQAREERKKLSEACAEVLGFLNIKTGRRYKPVKANIEMIAARLREGATVDECRQVIAKKCREWRTDEKMEAYLRPKTLFNRTNFAQYQGELTP